MSRCINCIHFPVCVFRHHFLQARCNPELLSKIGGEKRLRKIEEWFSKECVLFKEK